MAFPFLHPCSRHAQVLLAALAQASAASAPSESLLPPGPFPVGFRSEWVLDDGRTYRTAFDDGRTYGAEKAPRPLLVLLWYPADATAAELEPMLHREYFAIASADERLAPLADALRAYARGVFVEQVLGAPEAELDDDGRARLEAALAASTLARRGAEPARGPFPIVIYHSGAGSSFEDNAALCEHLASHGFVVLGGAFQEADGSSLGVDAGRGSAEDVQFLLRWARALPFADWRRVGLAGHSAGAQAMLKLAAQPGCAGDALVLLDTTQDYYATAMPQNDALVREVSAGRAHLTRPMLVAAGPEAMFELCDSLVHAERTYLTLPELGHDEYISQGLQRLARIERAPGSAGEDAAEAARAPDVRATYRTLCESVRAFLEAELRGSADFAAKLAGERALPWTHAAPRLVHVPRGTDGPEPYDPESDHPPTPRQFRRLVREQGAAGACRVLARFREHQPRGPLYTSTMLAGSLLYGLIQDGRRDDAAAYYAALKAEQVAVLGLFEFLADISALQERPEQALHFLRLAHDLDPEEASVAEKLRKLEGRASARGK